MESINDFIKIPFFKVKFSKLEIITGVRKNHAKFLAKLSTLVVIITAVIYANVWQFFSASGQKIIVFPDIFPSSFGIIGYIFLTLSVVLCTFFIRKILRGKIDIIKRKAENGGTQWNLIFRVTLSIAILIQISPVIFIEFKKRTGTTIQEKENSTFPDEPSTPPASINNGKPAHPQEGYPEGINEALKNCKIKSGITDKNVFICPGINGDIILEISPIILDGIKIGEAVIYSMGKEYFWDYDSTNILKLSNDIAEINDYIKFNNSLNIIGSARFIFSVGTASNNGKDYRQFLLSDDRAIVLSGILKQNLPRTAINQYCTVPMGRYLEAEMDDKAQRPLIIVAAHPLDRIGPDQVPQTWTEKDAGNVFWGSIQEIKTGREAIGVSLSGYYSYSKRPNKIICD